ncbi:hypothetical protein [Pseudomonas sp. 22 E 5]|nr:hypothetical protein [Pseudomonas sp. 22 E 5]
MAFKCAKYPFGRTSIPAAKARRVPLPCQCFKGVVGRIDLGGLASFLGGDRVLTFRCVGAEISRFLSSESATHFRVAAKTKP